MLVDQLYKNIKKAEQNLTEFIVFVNKNAYISLCLVNLEWS